MIKINLDSNLNFNNPQGATTTTVAPIGYKPLTAGEYVFTFSDYEIREYKGGAKIPPCTQILVKLIIDIAGVHYCVFDRLNLVDNNEWKITNFFKSLGINMQGATIADCLEMAQGQQGRALVKQCEYFSKKQGKQVVGNEIKAYLY